MDTSSIRTESPKVMPDDTIETHYWGLERMRLHGCYEGFVYIGHMVESTRTTMGYSSGGQEERAG